MATFTINRADIQSAANFLQEYLSEQNPDGDFRPGTALNDLVIKSFAILFAYVKQEIETVRSRQSVTEILNIPEDSPLFSDDVTQALDALMSNWFLTRRSGVRVTGTVGVRFTRREPSLLIRKGHRFYLEGDKIFLATTDQTYEFTSSVDDYRLVSAGNNTAFEISVSVESDGLGSGFSIPSGEQASLFTFDPISAFAFEAVQIGDFLGGQDTESNEEFVERAKEAITKRDLSTFKSIAAVLLEQFSVIQDVEVVGYGDSEMQRDRIREKNRCLVVENETTMATEEVVTEDMKLYLKFNEMFGKNFPVDSTDTWLFDQIHLYEGVPKVDGFSNSEMHWVDGHLGNAIYLKSNQTVEIPGAAHVTQNQPFVNPASGNITITFWVKGRPTGVNNKCRVVHTESTGSPGFGHFQIYVTKEGYVEFTHTTPTSTKTISSQSNLQSINTVKAISEEGFSWVAATYLGDNILLFIDGVLQDSIRTGGIPLGYGTLVVGGSTDATDVQTFVGLVDNLIVYNTGKNNLQLLEIYNRQKDGSQVDVDIDVEAGEQVEDSFGLEYNEFFHVGGRVDIYSKTPIHKFKPLPKSLVVTTTSSVEANNTGAVTSSFYFPAEPVYRLYYKESTEAERVPLYEFSTSDTNTGEILLDAGDVDDLTDDIILRYSISVEDPMYLHSNRQLMKFTASVNDPTYQLNAGFFRSRFEYDSITSFESITSYVENRQNRIVAGDLLVKGFFPVYVKADIKYTLNTGVLALDETAAVNTIVSFINSIKPGDSLEASDIVALMYSSFGIGRVDLPLVLNARIFLPDNQSFDFSSENSLPVPDISNYVVLDSVLQELVSQRTIRYIAQTEDITVSLSSL